MHGSGQLGHRHGIGFGNVLDPIEALPEIGVPWRVPIIRIVIKAFQVYFGVYSVYSIMEIPNLEYRFEFPSRMHRAELNLFP